jgi:hypothetical protein
MPSKLCPHALSANHDVRAFVEAGCPLVKLVGILSQAEELLAVNPNLLVVGRVPEMTDANAEARSGMSPEAAARALIDRQKEVYRANPLIRIWEGPNEPVFGNADDPANMRAMEWYAAYEAERLRLLAEMGLRGVVGNFATGTPDLPMWTAFLPALEAAEQHNGFLGVHEYSSPWMWWYTGNYSERNCSFDPNFPGEGDTGWLNLRYRKVYRQFLIPNGVSEVPLVITECGLDKAGNGCPGYTSGPWREHLEFWKSWDGARDPIDYWRGPERDAERYYAEQLIWYDRELQKDSFVAGATIFTVGTIGDGWRPFDISGTKIVSILADHIRSVRAAEEAARAVQPPKPKPVEVPPPITAPAPQPETTIIPPGPGASRPAPKPNILVNASFEDGMAYFNDDTRELAVPAGWVFSFMDESTPREPRQTAPWGRPVTALINTNAVTSADRARIFAGGVFCWKISMTRSPVWVRLWQSVVGVTPGKAYRFTVNLLPDLIVRTHPQTAYASDPLSGEVRLTAVFSGQTFDTGWKDGRAVPFGRYTALTLDFTAPANRVEVAVEVRGRWALPMGAWYVDEMSLSAS